MLPDRPLVRGLPSASVFRGVLHAVVPYYTVIGLRVHSATQL